MDLKKMQGYLRHMEEDEEAGVNGTALAIEEDLNKQGQQLYWDERLGWYIGKKREEDEE